MFTLGRFLAYSSGLLFLGGIVLHWFFYLFFSNLSFFSLWMVSGLLYIIGIFIITLSSDDGVKISNILKYQLLITLFLLIFFFSIRVDLNPFVPEMFMNDFVGYTIEVYIYNTFPLVFICWFWNISGSNLPDKSITMRQKIVMIILFSLLLNSTILDNTFGYLWYNITSIFFPVYFIFSSIPFSGIIIDLLIPTPFIYVLLETTVYVSKKLDYLRYGSSLSGPYKVTIFFAQKGIIVGLSVCFLFLVPLALMILFDGFSNSLLFYIDIILSWCVLLLTIPLFFRIYLNYFNKNN